MKEGSTLSKAISTSFKEKTNRAMGANAEDAKLTRSFMVVAFIALLLGGIFGFLQGIERAGLINLPHWLNYYQVLTAHGILLVLVLTMAFTIGL